METIRIVRRIESDTLYLPELHSLIGKTVAIVVSEEAVSAAAPAGRLDALTSIAGQNVIDPDAYKELRAASAL